MHSNCVSVWCCSRELKYAGTRFLAPRQFQRNLLTGDVRRHRFLSNPIFLTKICSFIGHVVAKPATNFKNKREEHSAEVPKTRKYNSVEKKTRNAPSAFSNSGGIVNWHPLKLCCYNEKIQRSNAIVERGPLLRLVVPKRYPSTLGNFLSFLVSHRKHMSD